MDALQIHDMFKASFDLVGIIETKRYLFEAKKMGKSVPDVTYPTMVVLGLVYPKRIIKHTKTHLVPSFYTFGSDYHLVLKHRIDQIMEKTDIQYQAGVDNHPHDERLAAVLSGLGFFGKNQLIINPTYGSYFFLGIVFLDIQVEKEVTLKIDDDCGTCRKCIDACPVSALSEQGFQMELCMSHYNQSKRRLTDHEMDRNYALFGCDICQMVCPKNIAKSTKVHPEFELSGKEMVSIVDLFTDSERVFKSKYQDMSYLWKGKTVLMRNALLVMRKQNNTAYLDLIEASIKKNQPEWYIDTATRVIEYFNRQKIEKSKINEA
jgi:epoxyqueuosine reductase